VSAYSVANAKAGLPGLIDKALAGEEVIITRHGKPVAELRPARTSVPTTNSAAYERLRANRATLPPGSPNSVELLNMIYDEPDI